MGLVPGRSKPQYLREPYVLSGDALPRPRAQRAEVAAMVSAIASAIVASKK